MPLRNIAAVVAAAVAFILLVVAGYWNATGTRGGGPDQAKPDQTAEARGVQATSVPETPQPARQMPGGTAQAQPVQPAPARSQGNGGDATTATSVPTAVPTQTPVSTLVPTPATIACPSVPLAMSPSKTIADVRVGGFIPDTATNVDIARGEFKNTLGLGTEGFLAEPGGLLVGPDFESDFSGNPFGDNPNGWRYMWNSKGHIKPFSAVSQAVLGSCPPAFQNLPEGGFVKVSAGRVTAELADGEGKVRTVLEFPHLGNHNWFLIVRGLYPTTAPNPQNSNRNMTFRLSNYMPGHTLVEMYEAGGNTNTAFISEGQFLQTVITSQRSGTNCGAGGCSGLTTVLYDVNTGAFVVVNRSAGRDADPKSGWALKHKNF